jgi:hypothetical protein
MGFTNSKTRVAATVAVAGAVMSMAATANAMLVPGTPAKDVHVGRDNDNANNTFIQPSGVTAKQHMDDTDVVFGRDNDDLLIGVKGGDTLIGGRGHDILVGGPEAGTAPTPNSDVLLGDEGHDINIWAPGDGSDAFVGDTGYDTMVFAPFVLNTDGTLKLRRAHGRKVPQVDIGGKPQFSCTIVPVPASQNLGAQFLVRFNVNGNPVVTVRQKDVERLLCTSPIAGKAAVADLTVAHPTFRNVWLTSIPGTLGDIVKAP